MKHSREPVKVTCPDIDKLLKSLKYIYGELKNFEKDEDIDSLKERLGSIENELWGFEDVLEELRSSNASLRDWGHEEAKYVDELEDKLYNLENETNH